VNCGAEAIIPSFLCDQTAVSVAVFIQKTSRIASSFFPQNFNGVAGGLLGARVLYIHGGRVAPVCAGDSGGHASAIDGQGGAVHKVGLIAGEVDGSGGDFLGTARATGRRHAGQLVKVLAHARGPFGAYRAG
jgi:hypothetical protein